MNYYVSQFLLFNQYNKELKQQINKIFRMISQDLTKTTITFMLLKEAIFQISLQTSKSTTIQSIIQHIVKTISMDIKDNPGAFFQSQSEQIRFVYASQSMDAKYDISQTTGSVSEKLFYKLTQEQVDMLTSQDYERKHRIEKPMKAQNMQRKFKSKKVTEQPIPQPVIQTKNVTQQSIPERVTQTKKQQPHVQIANLQSKPLQRSQVTQLQNPIKTTQTIQQLNTQTTTKLPEALTQQKSYTIKSPQTTQTHYRQPQDSSYTNSRSTYFEHQPNLGPTGERLQPVPVYTEVKPIEQSYRVQTGSVNQKQIVQQPLRSQSVQQVKQDACCQII